MSKEIYFGGDLIYGKPLIGKISHEEAARPHRLQNAREAIVIEPVKGEYCRFRKGESVYARRVKGAGFYLIDRKRWRGALVPLANQLYGVIRKQIQFI